MKQAGAKIISIQPKKDTGAEQQTILQQAVAAEKNNDLELAEKFYRRLIQQKTFNELLYTRLMIIYRKQKKYKEELEIINKGLQHLKEHYEKQAAERASNPIIKKLSKSLNKSLGLTDKKGNLVYEPEPFPAWKKRKITVEKKLK